ncbi:MAG: dethiobiotin synthase, partial [Methylobacterium sp.]|nr:dethiobiotin synthase [Methylobacterium sp.]
MMEKSYFITGTDTGVGKTLVTSALVHAFVQQGYQAAALKPVAAGCVWHAGRLLSEDVAQLEAASNVELPAAIVNPYALEPPVAPHIAAKQAGVGLDLEVMLQACEAASGRVDRLLVEGVGGFRVPFSDREDSADLAVRLGLPLIMVVGMRLGCQNHALLTAEAIAARGLR